MKCFFFFLLKHAGVFDKRLGSFYPPTIREEATPERHYAD